MKRQAILKAAIKQYGNQAQIDMCIEEMSELTKALLKLRRSQASQRQDPELAQKIEDVREEIADVQIMLDQMRLIFGVTNMHENEKLERLKRRLSGVVPNE